MSGPTFSKAWLGWNGSIGVFEMVIAPQPVLVSGTSGSISMTYPCPRPRGGRPFASLPTLNLVMSSTSKQFSSSCFFFAFAFSCLSSAALYPVIFAALCSQWLLQKWHGPPLEMSAHSWHWSQYSEVLSWRHCGGASHELSSVTLLKKYSS
jgi:hypothetical protein